MGERAMNYLALRTSAINKISTEVLSRLVQQSGFNRAHAEGRVFVFETNFAPMYTRKGPGSTYDLECELDLQRYLCSLREDEFRLVRVTEAGEKVDHRGEWMDHPFNTIAPVASIQADFDAVMNSAAGAAAHPACKIDVSVNSGALTLALNVLRRAGKHEVADALEATAQRESGPEKELIEEINRLVQQARSQVKDPFSIRIDSDVDVEIRPAAEGSRVYVGRNGWGFTAVNYSSEGLVLDVFAEEDHEPTHTACIHGSDLCIQFEEPVAP